MAEARRIIGQYADFRIGLADASNVVLANRHDTLDVITLDERRFRALRGRVGVRFIFCRPTPVDLR